MMLHARLLLRTMLPQHKKERYFRMRKPELPPKIETISRRTILAASLPLLLAACGRQGFDVLSGGDYGTVNDGDYTVPAVESMEPGLMREEVSWRGNEKPGSIVVNIPERKLYLIGKEGRALRYSVGVGRAEALKFRGSAINGRKEKWPHWTPTATKIAEMPRKRA